MYNLVLADLFKLRKSVTVKILFFITFLSAIIVAVLRYLINRGDIGADTMGIGFLLSDISMMTLLGSVMAASMICGDFENKTIQDSISCGNSRSTIVVAKALSYFVSIMVILLPYAIVAVIVFCMGIEFNQSFSITIFQDIMANAASLTFTAPLFFKMVGAMLTTTVVYAARLSVCILFAILLKKPILVIGVGYGVTLFFDNISKLGVSFPVIKQVFAYTPYSGDVIGITMSSSPADFIKAIVISLVFIIAVLFLTYMIFRKSEVK